MRAMLLALIFLSACSDNSVSLSGTIRSTHSVVEVVQFFFDRPEDQEIARGVTQRVRRDESNVEVVRADLVDVQSGENVGVVEYEIVAYSGATEIGIKVVEIPDRHIERVRTSGLVAQIYYKLTHEIGDPSLYN